MRVPIFLFACLLASSPAVAVDDMDPRVAFVVSVGVWEDGGNRGTYRFVTKRNGYEHVSSSLWLQWVAHPDGADSQAEVVESLLIGELNSGFLSFESPVCENEWPCQSFLLRATHVYSNESQEYEIEPDGVGKYQFREESP